MARDDEARAARPGVREWLGWAAGAAAAFPVAAISGARRARMFHPRGIVLTGKLDPILDAPHEEVARGISGHALVRLSGALAKRPVERFEVLGLALRISDERIVDAMPRPRDQDLTFATILSPMSMLVSPFTTRSDDFLANRYNAVAPFQVAGIGRMKLRLVPQVAGTRIARRESRADRLEADVRAGHAVLVLEGRRTFTRRWIPLAKLTLTDFSDVDQEALRIDPFRDGRGITPVGFVHALRRATYAASQAVRPRGSREPEPELAVTLDGGDEATAGAPPSTGAGDDRAHRSAE